MNEARSHKRKNKINTLSLDSENFLEAEVAETNQAIFNLQAEDQKRMINDTLSKLSPRESLLMRLFSLR